MSDPNKPDNLSPEESAARDEAEKQVNMAAKELQPVSLTLNGEEAMELAIMILSAMASGQEQGIHAVFNGIKALRKEGKSNEEAIKEVFAVIETDGTKVPRYLTPLFLHCITKLDEIKERES